MKDKRNTLVLIVWILAAGLIVGGTMSGQAASSAPGKLDLNKATVEQLSKCPGLTDSLAKAIVEYRDQATTAPFKTPADLLKVKGMTKEILSNLNLKTIKDILYVVPDYEEEEEEPSLEPSKC